jgi:lipopolysaccharide transport system ATP-binding protein
MSYINFHQVSVEFPIFNARSRSLKEYALKIATGGRLGKTSEGVVSVKALDNINFTFQSGEKIGVVGHNGSGKSTLLRVLGGAYVPTNGIATIKGSISSLIDIGTGIDEESTGRQNVYIRGALLGISKKILLSRIDDIIEFSQLGQYIDLPVRIYSTGMQLRLAFAISTIIQPNILIMDEWLSVGDEDFKDRAESRLQSLLGKTDILVIASHSPELVLKMCTRALWLEHGQLRMDSSPEKVVAAYFNN